MDSALPEIAQDVPPRGPGCAECLGAPPGWWLHLRRCAACGLVGCRDNSPSQHARHRSGLGRCAGSQRLSPRKHGWRHLVMSMEA